MSAGRGGSVLATAAPPNAAIITVGRRADGRWFVDVIGQANRLEEFPDLDQTTVVKMAESRRKAWYSRMAMKSVVARARRRGRSAT